MFYLYNQLYNGASPSHTCMRTIRMGRYHAKSSPTQGYIVKTVLEEHNIVYCEMMNKDQEALKRIGHFVPSKVKDGYANLPSIVDLRDEYLLEGEMDGAMPGDWAKDGWDALSPDVRRTLQAGWLASVCTSYMSDLHNVPFRLTTKLASRC